MSVEDRLTILETKFEERWKNHDKRSEESWGYLKESNALLFSKLEDLKNCFAKRKESCMKESRNYTHGLIIIITAIGGTIFGAVKWIVSMVGKG